MMWRPTTTSVPEVVSTKLKGTIQMQGSSAASKSSSERTAGNGTKVTPPDSPDSFGIIGKSWAFFGKTETTGSGALHFHVVVWGGLSPELLESVSDVPELCATVAECWTS